MRKGLIKALLNRIDGRDVAVFLLSLLLAFAIWLTHNLSLLYSSLISVPVVAESNLEGRSAESSNTTSIVARCRTTGYNLLKKNMQANHRPVHVFFSPDDLHHEEDDFFSLSSNVLGGYVSELFGDDVQLESFVSSSVQFRFPSENHKRVPVQPISVVTFKPQYTASEPLTVAPDSVTVYGEPAQLDHIDRVLTNTISLQNLSSSAHGVVKLETPVGVRISDKDVSYSLEVTRYVEVKASVSVSVSNVPSGKELLVYPSVVDVVFKCVFPLGFDPSEGVRFYVDYHDFINSINGRCVPKVKGLSSSVISYSIEPQVVECIEK